VSLVDATSPSVGLRTDPAIDGKELGHEPPVTRTNGPSGITERLPT
jgi:hypothetical protein